MIFGRPSTLWKYTARNLRRRPGRTLLTLLGIAIGVATAMAVTLTVEAARLAHREMFDALAGRAALEVVAEGLGGFPEETTAQVENVPGVRAIIPAVQNPAALLGPRGVVPVIVVGSDPARDSAAREHVLRSGRLPEGENGLLLEAGFAQANGLALGAQVRLFASGGTVELPLVGTLEPRGAAAFNGGAVAFLPLRPAQRLFGLSGKLNTIQLVLHDTAEPREVEAELTRRLTAGLRVQVPAARGALGRDGMFNIEQGLASFSAGAAVAGAFVILNAFLMSLGERRRQFAVLRALGATSRQVTRLLLREALLLGCAGTLVGVVLGLGLSVVFRHLVSVLNSLALPDPGWPPGPFLLALALGPGMALAAAFAPARRAARRAPLEDLLQKGAAPSEPLHRWPGYVGLGMLAVVGVLLFGINHGWFDPFFAATFLAPAVAVFLAGWVLIVPLILGPLQRAAAFVLRRPLGREGVLAFRFLGRRPGRTSLTVGVLLAVMVFAAGSAQVLFNNLRHIRGWFDRVIAADFFVRGTWPDITTAITTTPLPDKLAGEVERLDPAVMHVNRFAYVSAQANGRPAVVMAYSYAAGQPMPLALEEGDRGEVLTSLLDGEVAMGSPLARRLGLRVGDRVTLSTRQGPVPVRVAGLVAEYTGGGMALYMEWHTARRLFGMTGPHALTVTAQPGQAGELAPKLREFCARRGLLFQSSSEVRETLEGQMTGFLGFLWVLLGLIVTVAALGVVNTLTMNVLEQTRELAVLRAVGLKRGQVTKLVLAQGLGLAAIALLPGLLGALGLAWMMGLTGDALVGLRIPFSIDPGLFAVSAVIALGVAALAALLPARRAARIQVVEALQYE
ncbi:MAG: FtsX-like permease family protein [Gemmataceae bacterium]|nr:FtsX-like permease family protein [Gemmataceae bacterium]